MSLDSKQGYGYCACGSKVLSLLVMKNFVFLTCILALFVAGFASATHVHIDAKDTGQQVALSADQGKTDNGNAADPLCDMHCAHHHYLDFSGLNQTVFPDDGGMLFGIAADYAVSSPIYGLKRPPRA